MSQVTLGTASATHGSPAVVGTGTSWLSTVSPGDLFAFRGEGVWEIVAAVIDDTHLTLDSAYVGSDKVNASYEVQTSFSPTQGFPLPGYGDNDTASLISLALLKIDAKLTALSTVAAAMQGDLTLDGDLLISVSGDVATAAQDQLTLQVLDLGPVVFEINGSEAMRLDASGRLGIGTSLPAVALDVVGDARLSGDLSAATLTLAGAVVTGVPVPTTAQIGQRLVVVDDGHGGATLAYQ